MQTVSSRIWTRVAVFISYDDNHYTTGISSSGVGVTTDLVLLIKTAINANLHIWSAI